MPIFSVTRRNIRLQIARGYNDMIATSGSLANPTLTTFHAPELVFGANNNMLGAEVSFYAGGGASQADSRRFINAVTPYSAGSPSLYGRIDVLQPWAAAPSTNSGWEVHKLFQRQQYEDAITGAVRKVARRMLLAAEEFTVGAGGIRNPGVDIWLAGTSSAPTGWTLNGTSATVAREGTIIYRGGRFSALLTNGASQTANLTATTLNLAKWAGRSITLRAMVYTTTAARAFIRFNDGSTSTDSANHPGTSGSGGVGQWRELSVAVTVPNNPTAATCSLQISTGAAINVYLAKMWFDAEDQWAYPLENRLAFIQDVFIESDSDKWTRVEPEHWFIDKDRTLRELTFLRQYFTPTVGAYLRIVGQQYPTDPGETDNLPVDPEYVLARASSDLYRQLPANVQESYVSKLNAWEDTARRMERQTITKPYPGSRAVEDL